MQKIYNTIRKLGATSIHKGFYFLADAIYMTIECRTRVLKVTKDIYPHLSKKYKTTDVNIERCIRAVVDLCWKKNKNGIDKIAGYHLNNKPTNSEFIDMLAYYLSESDDK